MSLSTEQKGGIVQQYRRNTERHGLAGSADRTAVGAHQRARRALHHAQARPRFAPRAAEDGEPAPQAPRLSQGHRTGALPGRRRAPRPAALIAARKARASSRTAAASRLSPLRPVQSPASTRPAPGQVSIVSVNQENRFPTASIRSRIETGEMARQADGAVVVIDGRHRRARHRRRPQGGRSEEGLLPADRQLHREDLRRGPHPRRLLQARRPAHRERDADLAPDRPSDPPAVPGRLLQRSAGRRDRHLARTRTSTPIFPRCSAPRRRWRCPACRSSGPIGAAKVGYKDGQYILNPDRHAAEGLEAGPRRRRHARSAC